MNSKEIFCELLTNKVSERVVFVPLICSFAAKMKQLSVKEMFSSPDYMSNCQRDAQKLFKYDAITNIFDTSLEAEALGCKIEWQNDYQLPRVISHPLLGKTGTEGLNLNFEEEGRMPIVIEATKRLTTIAGKQAAIIGVVTGPLTLSNHLRGNSFLENDCADTLEILDFAVSICLKVASIYCQLNVDAILIVEDFFDKIDQKVIIKAKPLFESIRNVVHYFEKPLLVLPRNCKDPIIVEDFCDLEIDGLILDNSFSSTLFNDNNICVANTIPTKELLFHPDKIKYNMKDNLNKIVARKSYLVSTDWEVPYNTPIENMMEIVNVLKEIAL